MEIKEPLSKFKQRGKKWSRGTDPIMVVDETLIPPH